MNDPWRWIRRFGLFVVAAILATVMFRTVWFQFQDRVPHEIRMATGHSKGMYHRYSEFLKRTLEIRDQKVTLAVTAGSLENVDLLRRKEVDLAIVQAGSVSMHDVVVVAPMAREIVHVVVRQSSQIREINDLIGKHVALGESTSGMRQSAMQVLQHYGIELTDLTVHEGYFQDLTSDKTLDAAIVTTGFENSDLRDLLKSPEFGLIPIGDADALALKHSHFQRIEIPKGLYFEHPTRPSVPLTPLVTVTTTALLVCRPDAPPAMVREVLNALYDHDLHEQLSGLLPRDGVLRSTKQRWHKEAREYFDPFDQIGYMANVMESLAAIKDLFWATGGLIGMSYLIWRKRRQKLHRLHIREKLAKRRENSQKFKEELDKFLKETISIERDLGKFTEPRELESLLQKISEVKLRALNELTEETLRGNRMFLIFLQQCGHLSQAVRGKIWLAQQPGDRPPHEAPSNEP